MRVKQSLIGLAILAASSPTAFAQDADEPWKGEGEVGLLITRGNSESTNINARLALKQEIAKWRNNMELRSVYSQSRDDETGEEETTAEKYAAQAETNYKFDERQFWFLRGAYTDDRFSGYDFQSSTSTGYGNRVWEQGERSFLELKAGAGYRYNKLDELNDDGEDAEKGAILRFAGAFNYELSPTALFVQELSSEVGLEDDNVISESLTSLQADVVGNLSMKLSYRVQHQSQVPPDTEKVDTEISLALLYGF
ncbi:DUF481 domain-containing protein [Marinobacter halodurans]|uniref:DUF481 domain-containing protein n=1 Tax=Marinobacter halodurans TaxID=2528979 RepID=A0ABY1ZK58_9GAMM|nr:DUF481 domain-containing protein [Marinobacter halodurans]TBW50779.1 DUF481 domain-containing protein [Marinobacter halodurans]